MDDELEQIVRDAEIDARVDETGEPVGKIFFHRFTSGSGGHNTYRKDLSDPWGEVDWCDACGCEVFFASYAPRPGLFVRYKGDPDAAQG
jgi:hypothetical protein